MMFASLKTLVRHIYNTSPSHDAANGLCKRLEHVMTAMHDAPELMRHAFYHHDARGLGTASTYTSPNFLHFVGLDRGRHPGLP
jgi:hypothetical protein